MSLDPIARLRLDHARLAGRSLAMPIAGALVWAAAGIAGLVLETRPALFALLFCTGLAFPLALLLARPLGEDLLGARDPLSGLMGRAVLMVNLLWPVHLTVLAVAPEVLPLTLAIGLGLHWVVFGWVAGHGVGLVHALVRTAVVTAAWWTFPDARATAVSIAASGIRVSVACAMPAEVMARPARRVVRTGAKAVIGTPGNGERRPGPAFAGSCVVSGPAARRGSRPS